MNSDEKFVQDFETGALPKEEWTHAAHVRVTWYYLGQYSLADATEKIRSGIQNFVKIKGLNASGYNETLTLVYIHLIEFARGSHKDSPVTWDDFKNSHTELFDRENPPPLTYYRRETLQSEEAKTRFVPPDLRPLPII